MNYVPSELKPTRQRELPSHLQDFHCYTNIPTNNTPPLKTSPYPMLNFISYSYLSQLFRAFINIITSTKIHYYVMGLDIEAFIRT